MRKPRGGLTIFFFVPRSRHDENHLSLKNKLAEWKALVVHVGSKSADLKDKFLL